MTILMTEVNASLEHMNKELAEQIKKLVERIEQISSEDDLGSAKIENINAILNMPHEEFNTRLYNLEREKIKGKLLWNPEEDWLTIHRKYSREEYKTTKTENEKVKIFMKKRHASEFAKWEIK